MQVSAPRHTVKPQTSSHKCQPSRTALAPTCPWLSPSGHVYNSRQSGSVTACLAGDFCMHLPGCPSMCLPTHAPGPDCQVQATLSLSCFDLNFRRTCSRSTPWTSMNQPLASTSTRLAGVSLLTCCQVLQIANMLPLATQAGRVCQRRVCSAAYALGRMLCCHAQAGAEC